jgi:hypothetical protein
MFMSWETPDIRKLIEQLRKMRAEATVSANAGSYQVPLGTAPKDAGISKGYQSLKVRKNKLK